MNYFVIFVLSIFTLNGFFLKASRVTDQQIRRAEQLFLDFQRKTKNATYVKNVELDTVDLLIGSS